MKMTFLGAGSAFTTDDDNFQSNILIERNGRRLLLDCGGDARWSLKQLGLGPRDIHEVYISHCHADHVGGMEWLGFSTYFCPGTPKPALHAAKDVCVELWTNSLSGGMTSIQGKLACLETYFDVKAMPMNGTFKFEDIEFQMVQVVHIVNGFSFVPSYGLMWSINGKTVFWTSDAQFAPNQITDFYNMADLIFQDCETMFAPDGSPIKSGVHAHYSQLVTLPNEVRAKMWLYHYQPGALPDAVGAGFRGFARKHQSFEF